MDGLKKLSDYWANKLNEIGDPDPSQKIYEDMAGAGNLQQFGPLVLIDSLVLKYPAYNHDQIFNLSLALVYQLLAIGKQRDAVTRGAASIRRKTEKK